jgi:hypothetical protein
MFAARYWSRKLKKGGTLVIEDVANPEAFADQIQNSVDAMDKYTITRHDYRPLKGRYDDYIIEIVKD